MSKAQIVSDFRRRRKENLIKIAGNKCNICGYDKVIGALEFHHLIPEEKEYGISAKGTCHDIEKDLKEIQKCILVCANCHREIHNNCFSLDELKNFQIFNQELAQQLKEDRDKKLGIIPKEKVFCSNCGIEITGQGITGMCSKCVSQSNRISKRPSREELKNLIRNKPFTQIGKQFGVSDNAIRKWCDAENLPRKVFEIKSYSDEEWELI